MIGCIITFLLSWLSIATIAYLLSSVTDFKPCVTNGGTLMFMLIFGWIPSMIIGANLSEKYR